MSELFPREVRFHEVSVELELSTGSRIYIAHGDLVDTEDTGYLKLRKFFRSPWIDGLSRVLPGKVTEGLAMVLSRGEEAKAQDLPENWPSSDRERLRKKYRSFAEERHRQGFDFVVLGHCHDLDAVDPFYWNMGYPPVHRQFIYWEAPVGSEKEKVNRRNFLGF